MAKATEEDVEVNSGMAPEDLVKLRETVIMGGDRGFGVGLQVFLAQTSPADPLRPALEAKLALCEKLTADPTKVNELTEDEQTLLVELLA